MGGLEIGPFSDGHLDAAALPLAARHARHRRESPLLPHRYEEPGAARDALEEVWRVSGASGAVAVDGGTVVGYLVGTPRPQPIWGPNVWIEAAGHAVEAAETIRSLYAHAAARWVEEGRTRHYALVPATDAESVAAWFRLGFGQQQALAVREVPPETKVRMPPGFDLREPVAADVDALIDVDLVLPEYQRSSPVFASVPLPTRDESREEWVSTLSAGEEKLLVAYTGDRAVACWAVVPSEGSREHRGLIRPERSCLIAFAATLPEFRGAGIGVALTDASFAWAAEHGFETTVTDWRVTNLAASRFWPRRGFRETFLRLYRSIP
jgi:ribosomal protein S18 acetylase RimI-like enzyme